MGQYYINMSPDNFTNLLPISQNVATFPVKAKYYKIIDQSGKVIKKLASIQRFSYPLFCPPGWESYEREQFYKRLPQKPTTNEFSCSCDEHIIDDIKHERAANVIRARRRAKGNAFDIIMCNPDLDFFCTFTYAPEKIADKRSYEACYKVLAPWLSNRVQRKGLKYVCVPEFTQAGDIHFHAIMNSSALFDRLVPARNPRTGEYLTHNGAALYNISDWPYGFTSCEFIRNRKARDNAREAVAKYIFKYMGKNEGQKIGGRYVLIGGDVKRPVCVYANDVADVIDESELKNAFHKSCEVSDGLTYDEWSFV